MGNFFSKFWRFFFVVLVFASILAFYTAYDKATKSIVPQKLVDVLIFKDFGKSLSEFNKAAALAGIALISFVFIVGPLSRMWPKVFGKFLCHRKFAGLGGFFLIILHSVYSIAVFYNFDFGKMFFENAKWLGVVAAIAAFAIFAMMALTSNSESVKRLGYQKWKLLQRIGYIALFFSIIHFIVLETKPSIGLDVRPYGLLVLFLALFALFLRIGITVLFLPHRKSFEEHIGECETESQKS